MKKNYYFVLIFKKIYGRVKQVLDIYEISEIARTWDWIQTWIWIWNNLWSLTLLKI